MATITIKNGTPIGNDSLCLRCVGAHFQRGFRESEMVVYCARIRYVLREVPFAVRECNDFRETDMPSREYMEDIALIIDPSPTLKPAGFRVGQDQAAAAAVSSKCND